MKWLISTMITGENVFAEAYKSFLIRSGSKVGENEVTTKAMYEAMKNYAMGNAIKVFVLLFLIFILICVVKSGGWREKRN